jgi:SAM-dependent methyltransferase
MKENTLMASNLKSRDGNRRVKNSRLAYYKKNATLEFWEDLWKNTTDPQMYEPYLNGALFYFEKIFTKHLPPHCRVLEAGCGQAQYVVALNARGYDCIGFDYALHAMQEANAAVGNLPLTCGDITAMGFADDVFDAVISLGVVEHSETGPEKLLADMRRVLKPEGVLLISVPFFNSLRQWRARHGAYQDDVTGLGFYQYAFSFDEFSGFLRMAGFSVETYYTYSHQNTLRQELHWLKRLPVSMMNLILRFSKYVPYVNSQLGHMMLVVARKKDLEK